MNNNTRVFINPLYKMTRRNNTRRGTTRRNASTRNNRHNVNSVVVRNPAGLALFAQGWRNKQNRLKTMKRFKSKRFGAQKNNNLTSSNNNNTNLSNANVKSVRNLTKVY